MKIGQVSSLSGLAPSAIRFYEASGLLPPASRGPNGYRIYDEDTLQRLLMIQLAQRLGFSLESLRDVLSWDSEVPQALIRERLAQRLSEIDAMQARLEAQRAEVRALSEKLEAEWAAGRCLELAPVIPSSRRRLRHA